MKLLKPVTHSKVLLIRSFAVICMADNFNVIWVQVPWGWKETGLGFLGWILSFLLTSLITIPAILAFTQTSLQARNHADLSSFRGSSPA